MWVGRREGDHQKMNRWDSKQGADDSKTTDWDAWKKKTYCTEQQTENSKFHHLLLMMMENVVLNDTKQRACCNLFLNLSRTQVI